MILNLKKIIAGFMVVASFNSVINANASYYHRVREEFNQSQSIETGKDMYEQIFDMLEEGARKYTSENCEESFKNSDFGKIINFYLSIKNGISNDKLKFYKEKYEKLIDEIQDKKSAFDVLIQLQNDFNLVYDVLELEGETFPCLLLNVEGSEGISEKNLDLRSFFEKTSNFNISDNEIEMREQQFNNLISNENLDKLKSLLNQEVNAHIDNINIYKTVSDSFNPDIINFLIRSIGPDFLSTVYDEYLNNNPELKDDIQKVKAIYSEVKNLYINRIKSCDWISAEKKELAVNTLERKINFNISKSKECENNWKSFVPDDCKLENLNFLQDDILNNSVLCNQRKKHLLSEQRLPADYKSILLSIYQHSIYMDPYSFPFDSFSVLVTKGAGLIERSKNGYRIVFPVPEIKQIKNISKIYQELKRVNSYDAFEFLTAEIIAHEMGHALDHLIGTLKDDEGLKFLGLETVFPDQSSVQLTSEQDHIQQIKDRLKNNLETKFNLELKNGEEAFADLCAAEIMMDYAESKNIDKKELFFILGNREVNEATVENYDHIHPTSKARIDGIFPNLDEFDDLISKDDEDYVESSERIHIFRK